MEIADRDGIDAVSMRRVASELGSGVMSLYRHVTSKDDVHDLLLDAAFGEIELLNRPSKNWRANLRIVARQTRTALKRHPWLAGLLSSRPPLGPNYLRHFEYSLASVAALGLNMETTSRIIGTFYVFIMGFTSYELAEHESNRRTGMTDAEKRQSVAPYIESVLASGRFPNLVRFLDSGATEPDDESFTFGLECVLDGIAARIPNKPR